MDIGFAELQDVAILEQPVEHVPLGFLQGGLEQNPEARLYLGNSCSNADSCANGSADVVGSG